MLLIRRWKNLATRQHSFQTAATRMISGRCCCLLIVFRPDTSASDSLADFLTDLVGFKDFQFFFFFHIWTVRSLAPGQWDVCLFFAGAAMKRINSLGIVHRDLKPQNLLLCFKMDGASGSAVPPGKKKRIRYPEPSLIVIKLGELTGAVL